MKMSNTRINQSMNMLSNDILVNDMTFIEHGQYYLVETFNQEKNVGTIVEQKIGINRFIRIDVPDKYGIATEYSKYLAISAIASMTPVSKDTAIGLVKVSEPVNRSFTTLTANNDDSDDAADNNDVFSTSCTGSSKITPTKLVNKESVTSDITKSIVSNILNENKQNLPIGRKLKARAFALVSLLSFLVLLILSIDQNMSLGTFLAFCIAPAGMLLMSIFELVILDLELI